MLQIKKILAPTDYSACAEHAAVKNFGRSLLPPRPASEPPERMEAISS